MQIDKKSCPPPGTYAPKTNLADTLPKQNCRAGGFGTKSTVRYDLLFFKSGCNFMPFCSDSISIRVLLVTAATTATVRRLVP